ncbi:MAG TPA: FkbM family methyltransferase [Gaiellaceae bacterium]|nr:FkbM family methyltransferase [Gaiellaceae bacterium]
MGSLSRKFEQRLRRFVEAVARGSLRVCRLFSGRRAQAYMRALSWLVRRLPDARVRRAFVRSALVLEDRQFDFAFSLRSAGIVWSAAGFPDLLTRHLMFEGTYQPEVLTALRASARRGGVVYDIGGHHGLMAVASARAVGEGGKVITFEPNPHARRHLQRHVDLNRLTNVHVESVAISDHSTESEFFVQTGSVTWNSTLVGAFARTPAFTEVVRVPVTSVDRYVAGSDCVPDVIKIDVEGSELAILRGSMSVLRDHRPVVIMELNPVSARAAGHTVDDYVDLLHSLSYEIWPIPEPGRRKHAGEPAREPFDARRHIVQDELVNVVCTPG